MHCTLEHNSSDHTVMQLVSKGSNTLYTSAKMVSMQATCLLLAITMKGQACRSCALSYRNVSHLGPLTAEVYGGSGGLVQLHRGEDNEDVLIQFWQCILQQSEGEGLSGLVLVEDDAATGGEIVSASCGDVAVVTVCVSVCVCMCMCTCVHMYLCWS